jgi:hypothetical protein
MASATNLNDARTPRGDAAEVYATRSTNIAVPGADQTDAALTTVETRAAARATDRGVHNSNQSSNYAPDAADYEARGSERGAP